MNLPLMILKIKNEPGTIEIENEKLIKGVRFSGNDIIDEKGNFLGSLRTGGEFARNAIYLDPKLNIHLGRDKTGYPCILFTKK